MNKARSLMRLTIKPTTHMKKLFSIVFAASAFIAAAQPKKAPKMAPMLAEGYYVTAKNDTVRGEIQTNPDDETAIYHQFMFKANKNAKLAAISPKKAVAYGFDGRHFIQFKEGEEFIYLERLAGGRLNFFEYKFNGKIDGYPGIESAYYAQDTRAEGADAGLKQIQKISNKFYKKDLKPYMKDQPMIWSDLDKFTFNKQTVTNAINEYNKFYIETAN
jgi:hypothetical protein